MQKSEDVAGAVRHMKKSGALWIVIFAFAAGIIMLIIGSVFTNNDGDDKTSHDDYIYTREDLEAYSSGLTQSIRATCEKISGGEVYVFLDFESSGQVIYAQNTNISSDGDRREEYVIVGSGSGAQALYLGQSFPKLSGIGVVCASSVSQSKKDEMSALLASAYGLPLTRIYVL